MRTSTIDVARTRLNRFVVAQARVMRDLAGFGWRGDPRAPGDYRSLTEASVRSQLSGAPLPVSDANSEHTIYGGRRGNLAFRFWHDLTHLRLGRGFDLDGEIEVANAQLEVVRAVGFGPGSLEFELLRADTLGQTVCSAATGDFPADQMCFVRLSVGSTMSLAIRDEMRKRHG
jgi:hypothetical protein